ncbi:MAG: undecaprenyldiphospho-muramoylpentapeptide beta-N-acetylglucosaminyltransferase [Bacteroidota bacterium]
MKIIISGGGTGGHIFPAISVANALKEKISDIEILFVGAEGKMEMEKVPAAGYKIIGLPVRGFQRKMSAQNVSFFFKLYKSLSMARKIIRDFSPDVVAGFGGFASGPVLRIASKKRIPAIIQEQNSYAGVTNRILSGKVDKICVAYDEMDKFFPAEKIILTGNPVRQDLLEGKEKKTEAYKYFGLQGNRKTLLVVGGSLGARTINESVFEGLEEMLENKIQLIWQTGKEYYAKAQEMVSQLHTDDIRVHAFITRMDLAYAISDVVIARAGAITLSELSLLCKPSILVPSPNVAEDHQTKNAMTLIKNDAAMMVEDKEAPGQLMKNAIQLIKDEFRLNIYKENIAKMGVRNSASIIADVIIELVNSNKGE